MLAVATLLPTAAHAVPKLQLNILDGIYRQSDQTTVAFSEDFTLEAYVKAGVWDDPNNAANPIENQTFWLGIALERHDGAVIGQTSDGGAHGSFTITDDSGTRVVNVTADMIWGNAPNHDPALHQSKDLPSHGIYDTYYTEHAFSISGLPALALTDISPDAPSTIGTAPASGSGMYGKSFQINTVSLSEFLELHFDLYTLNDDGAVEKNAPFSHDASSWPPDTEVMTVSEPGTLGLLGLGLLGLGMARRRRGKVSHPSSRSPVSRVDGPNGRADTKGSEGITAGVCDDVEKSKLA